MFLFSTDDEMSAKTQSQSNLSASYRSGFFSQNMPSSPQKLGETELFDDIKSLKDERGFSSMQSMMSEIQAQRLSSTLRIDVPKEREPVREVMNTWFSGAKSLEELISNIRDAIRPLGYEDQKKIVQALVLEIQTLQKPKRLCFFTKLYRKIVPHKSTPVKPFNYDVPAVTTPTSETKV